MEIFSPLSSFLVLMSLSPLLPQIAILGYQRWFQTCSLFITVHCHHHLFMCSLTPKLLQKKKTLSLFFRQSNCRSCSFSTSLNTNEKQNGALIVFAKMLCFLAGQAVSNICSFYWFSHFTKHIKIIFWTPWNIGSLKWISFHIYCFSSISVTTYSSAVCLHK